MERYLHIAEVAKRINVPVSTLRHWRYAGGGPRSQRLGRRVVYRESDLEKWLAEVEAANSTGGESA